MRELENGWTGLRNYAARCGVCNPEDTDDVAAAKIKNVLRDTLPEVDVEQYNQDPVVPTEPEDDGTVSSDSESETEA